MKYNSTMCVFVDRNDLITDFCACLNVAKMQDDLYMNVLSKNPGWFWEPGNELKFQLSKSEE